MAFWDANQRDTLQRAMHLIKTDASTDTQQVVNDIFDGIVVISYHDDRESLVRLREIAVLLPEDAYEILPELPPRRILQRELHQRLRALVGSKDATGVWDAYQAALNWHDDICECGRAWLWGDKDDGNSDS